jgi:hypothetical protein
MIHFYKHIQPIPVLKPRKEEKEKEKEKEKTIELIETKHSKNIK